MAASARIDELRAKFDANPRRFFAPLANEYRKAGDLSTAIAICRTQLRLYPAHMSGNVVLGQALYEAGELSEAQQVFERAIALDPENLIALRHLGDLAYAAHDGAAARGWYRRVLDADPYNEQIAAALAGLDQAAAPPTQRTPPRGTDELVPASASAVLAAEEAEVVEAPNEDAEALFVDFSESDFEWTAPSEADDSASAPVDEVEVAGAAEPEPPAQAFDPVVGLDLPPDPTAPVDETPIQPVVAASEPTPEPPVDLLVSSAFATETMAQLCLDQGHDAEALAIYERLVAQRPADAGLRERAAALRKRLHPDVESDATAGEFLRRLAEDPDAEARDERVALALGEAFADPMPASARASAPVSAPEPVRAPDPPTDPALDPFERFFANLDDEPMDVAPPSVPAPVIAARATPVATAALAPEPDLPLDESEDDLAEFNAWLKEIRDS